MTQFPELEARIGREIAATGPITFARFMELALYEPGLGYYRRPEARPVREGDFLTAPEMHPIFGRTLAREIARLWDASGCPDPFRLVEYGAGAGTLALSIADALRRARSPLVDVLEYEPIEISERRQAELQERFREAGLVDSLVLDGKPPPVHGLVLANEFLDALPVHRVEWRDGTLRELFVGREDGRFVEVPGAPSSSLLAERLRTDDVDLAEGQQAEVCLELEGWLDGVVARLGRGFVLVIDYGFEAAELYEAGRRAGTLLAYERHRALTDYLAEPGTRDLTAHVDFTALRRLANARGFAELGVATQRDFLVAAGLGEELTAIQRDPATELPEYTLVRSAVRRLLDPRATGDFRVMLLGKGVDTSIRLSGAA